MQYRHMGTPEGVSGTHHTPALYLWETPIGTNLTEGSVGPSACLNDMENGKISCLRRNLSQSTDWVIRSPIQVKAIHSYK
jgi:hypothetical protein